MDKNNEIRFTFLFLDAKNRTFIKSLLAIYKNRAQRVWKYAPDREPCNVIFIGNDKETGESYTDLTFKPEQIVILLSEDVQIRHNQVFLINPYQFSCKIIEAVETCEAAIIKKDSLAQQKNGLITQAHTHNGLKEQKNASAKVLGALKLLRWPAISFFRHDPNYAILATLIMNKRLDFKTFVERSGFSLAYCMKFVNEAKHLGYIEVFQEEAKKTIESSQGMNDNKRAEKLGLFTKIRNYLGLRGAKK